MSITLLIVGLLTSCINKGAGTTDKDFVAETLISNDSTIVNFNNQCVQDSDTTVIISDSDEYKKPHDDKQEQISPVKRALVIGIGRYQDTAWSEIHGDRDVPIVKQMLKKCGYTDIYTLINEDATKSKIISMFSNLCSRCNTGDIVYIHFSGHGQQVTDVDGDEEDGWDEAWIPYDAKIAYSEYYKGEKHLTDDEVGLWLSKIKSKIGDDGKILVVVDACHSGDSSRDGINEDICIRGTMDDFVIPLAAAPKRIGKQKEDWLTLTACKDFQVNCEVLTVGGDYYGMLSYALCYISEDLGVGDNKEFMMRLQKFVNRHRSQLPQDATLTGETETHSVTDFFK